MRSPAWPSTTLEACQPEAPSAHQGGNAEYNHRLSGLQGGAQGEGAKQVAFSINVEEAALARPHVGTTTESFG